MRNSSFYRVVSFFPYTIPAIITGLLWAQMYDPSRGLLGALFLRDFGLVFALLLIRVLVRPPDLRQRQGESKR